MMKELVLRINKLIDQNEIRRISAMALNAWLRGMGLIEAGEGKYGKLRWVPSKLGEEIGIEVKSKMVYDREYFGVYYNRNAQEFIVNNIQAFAEERNKQ
jgi:hypothetical protein